MQFRLKIVTIGVSFDSTLPNFHHFRGNRWGNSGNSVRLYLAGWGGGGAPKSLQMVTAAIKSKDAYSLEGKF